MNISLKFPLVFLIALAIFLHACGTSDEVVVVEQTPRSDVAETADEEDEESFYELTIGLIDPVRNFDPLFARNLSTKRTLSLIYDGLFTLNTEGEPVPELASDVTISDDGLEYLITIDRENFYHDSGVFTAGLGRRIHASDIKWALERTARAGVPPLAAELLMNVVGYENYFLEQRNVYDERNRVLQSVNGIQVVDAETVGIALNEPDPDFLHKLASPYLSIYPRETLRDNDEGLITNPVGTGSYTFNRLENDRTVVLVRNDNQNSTDRPQPNRINLTYFSAETELFQQFANGEIDWIPEMGPEILMQVTDSGYNLQSAYRDSYNLINHNTERITTFYLHDRSIVNKDWLINRLALLTEEDITLRGNLTLRNQDFALNDEAEPLEEYYVAFTDNYIARALLNEFHNLIFRPESSLAFFDIRVPTRRTSIYTQFSDSVHQRLKRLPDGYWLRFDSRILSLNNPNVEGLESTAVPWDLQIKNIRLIEQEMTP